MGTGSQQIAVPRTRGAMLDEIPTVHRLRHLHSSPSPVATSALTRCLNLGMCVQVPPWPTIPALPVVLGPLYYATHSTRRSSAVRSSPPSPPQTVSSRRSGFGTRSVSHNSDVLCVIDWRPPAYGGGRFVAFCRVRMWSTSFFVVLLVRPICRMCIVRARATRVLFRAPVLAALRLELGNVNPNNMLFGNNTLTC